VTVIEGGAYVGEAVLPFTATGGEVVVPYAVELGIKVREQRGAARRLQGLDFEEAYLQFEEWDIRWREYQLRNSTEQILSVLVEHPRTAHYDLFDTAAPKEHTDEHLRFEVEVPAHAETSLRVRERRLIRRREELHKQSYEGLQRYLQQGLLDRDAYEKLAELMSLWEKISDSEQRLKDTDRERQKVYQAQQQIQGNMGALSATGREGALRTRYVEQLEATEDQLRSLDQQEVDLRAAIESFKEEVQQRIEALG
jgi:hypothetical protein